MAASARAGLPTRAALGPEGLYVALADIGVAELRDAFMQETVKRLPAEQTPVHVPPNDLGRMPAKAAPAGVIFHVSRCGSTLVSQLLKQHEGLAVYAEPLPMNELLVPPHKADRRTLVAALRSLSTFFAAHAGGPYVLKLTSWNTLFCDVVAEAFPVTPWALSIRDPLEVCVSLLGHRPGWLRDTALFAGIVDPNQTARSPEDHLARVYAAFCEAVEKLDPARGKLIPYEALPNATWTTLAPHFGLTVGQELQQRMAVAARTYSKARIGEAIAAFVPDNAKKRAAATPELIRAVDTIARPALQRLLAKYPA